MRTHSFSFYTVLCKFQALFIEKIKTLENIMKNRKNYWKNIN